MTVTAEFTHKRERIAQLMAANELSGLALGRSASWSWAMCGREANVGINSEHAAALLLFTERRDYLLASRIEMPRLLAEEAGDLPFEPVEFPWHEPARRTDLVTELAGRSIGADTANVAGARLLAGQIAALRYDLTLEEQGRFRELGAAAGAAVEAATRAVAPGMSERAIAGLLAVETFRRNATPVVALVAVDERVQRFRHPTPTTKELQRYALLVLCARRHGLIASASRLVHFGPLPNDLRKRALACARVDAAVHLATRPGRPLSAVFADLQAAYAAEGFPEEWRDHHQGGLVGYENREVLGTPATTLIVSAGQVYAWNPSIAGVKSEDTILVVNDGYEVLTDTDDWPYYEIEVAGQAIRRPAILEQ